jgi:hypothetical protein
MTKFFQIHITVIGLGESHMMLSKNSTGGRLMVNKCAKLNFQNHMSMEFENI